MNEIKGIEVEHDDEIMQLRKILMQKITVLHEKLGKNIKVVEDEDIVQLLKMWEVDKCIREREVEFEGLKGVVI